eukprot:scaffold36082_cov51-Phaeocystis_antarctica.AAC.5
MAVGAPARHSAPARLGILKVRARVGEQALGLLRVTQRAAVRRVRRGGHWGGDDSGGAAGARQTGCTCHASGVALG